MLIFAPALALGIPAEFAERVDDVGVERATPTGASSLNKNHPAATRQQRQPGAGPSSDQPGCSTRSGTHSWSLCCRGLPRAAGTPKPPRHVILHVERGMQFWGAKAGGGVSRWRSGVAAEATSISGSNKLCYGLRSNKPVKRSGHTKPLKLPANGGRPRAIR